MTLWELGNLFQGRMMAVGWTPEDFELKLRGYRVEELMLALKPEMALGDMKSENIHGFNPFESGALREAQGIPIPNR